MNWRDVLDACRYYFRETGRRVTFEYSLVAGVNDTSEGRQAPGETDRGYELPRKPDPGKSHCGTGFQAFQRGRNRGV